MIDLVGELAGSIDTVGRPLFSSIFSAAPPKSLVKKPCWFLRPSSGFNEKIGCSLDSSAVLSAV